jgi:hypothetical protein
VTNSARQANPLAKAPFIYRAFVWTFRWSSTIHAENTQQKRILCVWYRNKLWSTRSMIWSTEMCLQWCIDRKVSASSKLCRNARGRRQQYWSGSLGDKLHSAQDVCLTGKEKIILVTAVSWLSAPIMTPNRRGNRLIKRVSRATTAEWWYSTRSLFPEPNLHTLSSSACDHVNPVRMVFSFRFPASLVKQSPLFFVGEGDDLRGRRRCLFVKARRTGGCRGAVLDP